MTLGNKVSAVDFRCRATFPQPFYNAAFVTYEKLTNAKVTYGGIGSGGGIRSLKDKIVDFGASDAFLSNAELKQMPAPHRSYPNL